MLLLQHLHYFVPGAMRFPEEHPSEAQTHEFAVTYETTVNGLKEPSPLINLENYDVASGQPCEYMRSVLLGVTKQLTEHLDSTNSAERFDIGKTRDGGLLGRRLNSGAD